MARGPSLTFFFIGLVVFIGVMLLIYEPTYGLYNNFLIDNNKVPDNAYTSSFVGTLASTKSNMDTLNSNYSTSAWQSIFQTGGSIISGAITTLAIGFEALRTLSVLPTFAVTLFNSISQMLFIPPIISWIVITVITVFLASKFIKALRGTLDDA